MSDPLNTTAFDGSPCHLCGEEAITVETVAEGSSLKEVALCARCSDEQITLCPACEQLIWCKDGVRLYATANLYCEPCSQQEPVYLADLERASRADVARDDFNESRR